MIYLHKVFSWLRMLIYQGKIKEVTKKTEENCKLRGTGSHPTETSRIMARAVLECQHCLISVTMFAKQTALTIDVALKMVWGKHVSAFFHAPIDIGLFEVICFILHCFISVKFSNINSLLGRKGKNNSFLRL